MFSISTLRRKQQANLATATEDEKMPLTYECEVEAEKECADQIKVCIR